MSEPAPALPEKPETLSGSDALGDQAERDIAQETEVQAQFEALRFVVEMRTSLAESIAHDSPLYSKDPVTFTKASIAFLDAQLSRQINDIIHHEGFRKLEGTWRGLHYLVNHKYDDD